jgi:hypothetical protein
MDSWTEGEGEMKRSEMKPIETIYRGYRFRSRLEARWAVCLDRLGWPWVYEPQGYVLSDGTCYLPDFVLTRPHARDGGVVGAPVCFLEVKPFEPSESEVVKAALLAAGSGIDVLFAIGLPDAHRLAYGLDGIDADSDGSNPELLTAAGSIHSYALDKWGRPGWRLFDAPSDADFAACDAARAARFEHGEQP